MNCNIGTIGNHPSLLCAFRISEAISPYAYHLDLTEGMHVHPVFHVSVLSPPPTTRRYPGQRQEPPPPVEIGGEQEWYADAVLDSRMNGRGRNCELQYLVKWTEYEQPRWELPPAAA
jgi:hypothetical protein